MNSTLTLTLPEFAADLDALAKRLGNMTPAMKIGMQAAVSESKQRFNDSIGPKGEAWPKLKLPRIGSKGTDLPLLDKGKLRASITGTAGADWLQTGTAWNPIAKTQQFGATIVPKRGKWLSLPLTRKAQIAKSPRKFPGKLRQVTIASEVFLLDSKGTPQYRLIKKAVIPPRPFLGVSEKWINWFSRMLTGWVATGRFESLSPS